MLTQLHGLGVTFVRPGLLQSSEKLLAWPAGELQWGNEGGRSKFSRRRSRTYTCIWSEITAVQKRSECSLHSQAGILWPSDFRVHVFISFIYLFIYNFFFSLEASKLGEKELALVKQERVNFLSKKYPSVGGSCALFLEMDKVIF